MADKEIAVRDSKELVRTRQSSEVSLVKDTLNPRGDLVFEGARILFRNFAGAEGMYNREGDRNFALVIDNDIAETMRDLGWNIKYLKARDEGDIPQAYMQINVSFKNRPPRIVMITEKNGGHSRTDIPEELLSLLDWVEIANVDLIVNPYHWNVNGKTGIKAYLKSIYVTIVQDRLEQKYSDVPENNIEGAKDVLEMSATRVDDGQDPNDVIYAELVDDED